MLKNNFLTTNQQSTDSTGGGEVNAKVQMRCMFRESQAGATAVDKMFLPLQIRYRHSCRGFQLGTKIYTWGTVEVRYIYHKEYDKFLDKSQVRQQRQPLIMPSDVFIVSELMMME